MTGEFHPVFVALILVPVILVALAYVYLVIRDPGKLRSEKHESIMAALEFIQEQGGPIQIASTAETLDIRQNTPPPPDKLSLKEWPAAISPSVSATPA